MKIRRYHPGEESEIWDVFWGSVRNIMAQEYTTEQIIAWSPEKPNIEEWEQQLAKTKPFVALIDGQIVGFVELYVNGQIGYFYCHHEFQRQGVGTGLWQAVKEEAERSGITSLFAEVSTTAIDFFLAKGFEIEEEINDVYCGSPAKIYNVRKHMNT